jgi:hypothetical protein
MFKYVESMIALKILENRELRISIWFIRDISDKASHSQLPLQLPPGGHDSHYDRGIGKKENNVISL